MRSPIRTLLSFLAIFFSLLLLHLPLLRLPYFWDEAGYYVPAARDFYQSWLLIPKTTLPVGHTPLVMIYLGLAWRIFGYSIGVARAAMILVASATVACLYALARRIAGREIAAWSALLLALSPLFFAQSTLVHLDLAAALFTSLAILFVIDDELWLFALTASLALLAKETAVVLLPVAWLYTWRRCRVERRGTIAAWLPLIIPILPLAAWTLYYRHGTGYWTGNRGYLSYNLYSTLSPVRIFWSLARRAYELFIGGFNWLLTVGALAGIGWARRHGIGGAKLGSLPHSTSQPTGFAIDRHDRGGSPVSTDRFWNRFVFLGCGLAITYLVLLSVVGGAILPRYLLPVMPLFYLAAVDLAMRLPRVTARAVLAATAACFIAAWFINPPYPFPLEDNLAYADFIRLHQQTAHYLEALPGQPRILTAWPATDELTEPFLGYVRAPLRTVRVEGFTSNDLAEVSAHSYDLLYMYSRRWEPPGNWVTRFPAWWHMQEKYFDYEPQTDPAQIAARYQLRLVAQMQCRGQWVKIYSH